MNDLTDRQTKILKAIIEEYINDAEPVGSEKLERKYELGVSPATIRNEMIHLTETGYLKQPHTSAGRIPTTKAFHFYVNQLMQEKRLSVAEEVAAKEKVWDSRYDLDQLFHESTRALAKHTHALAIAATDAGELYHAGYSNILNLPEFYDIDVTKTVLSMIDDEDPLLRFFNDEYPEAINILLGNELGFACLEPCGMIFTRFKLKNNGKGLLGVIGANRFNYPEVIPIVRYYGDLIEELLQNA